MPDQHPDDEAPTNGPPSASPLPSPAAAGPIQLVRTMVHALLARTRRQCATALAVNLMVGCAEAVGLLLLVDLMQRLGLGGSNEAPSWIDRLMDGRLTGSRPRQMLPLVLGAYALAMVALAWLSKQQAVTTLRLEYEFARSLRRELYDAVMKTRWDLFCRGRSSDFSHALTLEVDRSAAVAGQLLSLCAVLLSTLAYFAMAVRVSPGITALVSVCAAVVLLSLRASAHRARTAGEALSAATSRLYGAIGDDLSSLRTTRSYGAESRHAHRFEELSTAVTASFGNLAAVHSEVKYRFDLGSATMMAAVVYVGAVRLAVPAPDILLLLFLFARLMPKVAGLRSGYQLLMSHLPSFATVSSTLDTCRAAEDSPAIPSKPITFRRQIRLEHVSFSYDRQPAIRDLSIVIPAGKTTALVGPSGSGKSTVADLVMGLIVPDTGRVLVDDVGLGPEHFESWRRQVGYVAQDAFLFHDTVRANLLWAKPPATEADLREALRLSAADEFVSEWPGGLDTVIGDRGVLVSGGERQRLALARALVRRPSLLILDEATSALDAANERRILEAVDRLPWSVTVIVITHRAAAISGADLVHVFEKGRVLDTTIPQDIHLERRVGGLVGWR